MQRKRYGASKSKSDSERGREETGGSLDSADREGKGGGHEPISRSVGGTRGGKVV